MKYYWKEGLPLTELEAVCQAAQAQFVWFYGERSGEVVLQWATETSDFTSWKHGVFFCEAAELAWWIEQDAANVRWLVNTPPETIEWTVTREAQPIQSPWAGSKTQLYGQNDGTTDDWAEARIPRRLIYPLPEADRLPTYVTVQTETLWVAERQNTLTRLCSLAGYELAEEEST